MDKMTEEKTPLAKLVEISRAMAAIIEKRQWQFTVDELAEIANLVREHYPYRTRRMLHVWGEDLGQCSRCQEILPHGDLRYFGVGSFLLSSSSLQDEYLCETCRPD